MKNQIFATLITLTIFAFACNLHAESKTEKKEKIAQEKQDKAAAKAKRKADYQKKEEIRLARKKATRKKIAEEDISTFQKSKQWDDYVPGRFMSDKEKGFSANKTDPITQINDSFTF